MSTEMRFASWCIVELFGHQKIAGRVTEQDIAGAQFIRVDVPNPSGEGWQMTRMYGPSAIYSLTPVAEEIARRAARGLRVEAVTVYLPALPSPNIAGPSDDAGTIDTETESFEDGEDER